MAAIKALLGQAVSTLRVLTLLIGSPKDSPKKNATKLVGLLAVWPDITDELADVVLQRTMFPDNAGQTTQKLMRRIADITLEPLKAAFDVLRERYKDSPIVVTTNDELKAKILSTAQFPTPEGLVEPSVDRETDGYPEATPPIETVESVRNVRKAYLEAIARVILWGTSKDPLKPNEDARPAYNEIMKEVEA
jgi:hypothetical protein